MVAEEADGIGSSQVALMLAIRVIPTVLFNGATCAKPVAFARPARPVGSAASVVRLYNRRQVDELCLLDVSGGEPDLTTIKSLADEISSPFSVGGGIRSVDDVANLLKAGADKIVLSASAPMWLIGKIAARWGSQAVVVHIASEDHQAKIAQLAASAGAGEILLTSRTRDGTMQGYDLDLIGQVVRSVTIPVIASGGARSMADCVQAIRAGAHAVAAASIFHFTELTPLDVKIALRDAGFPVRLAA